MKPAEQRKYAVYPGSVISEHDGQRHYVDAPTLMRLYRVSEEDCVVIRNEQDLKKYGSDFVRTLTPLRPRSNGSYDVPDYL